MSILYIILIALLAGIIARFLSPGSYNPSGFVMTVLLGIVGAFVTTWLGQAVGWFRLDQAPA